MNTILKTIKARLDNLEYRQEIPKDIKKLAKDNNILIVYGASDDLIEFDGVIYDELGAWDGFDYESQDYSDFYSGVINDLELKMPWCPDEIHSWIVEVKEKIEYEFFTIVEDGEAYCKGAIIQLTKEYKDQG